MTRVIVQALALMGVYLLVLTSTKPADAAAGLALGLVLAVGLRPRLAGRSAPSPSWRGLLALGPVLATTALEMILGSWRTARFCLRGGGQPGFVEIPRGERSRHGIAFWGVLTGEAPDEVPVDVDEERDVLIVHLIDASDPDAVRERHRRAYERFQRKVVP
ncbi:multicomponent K+:H+ antiporter subunit E/multicomponent Na+:H+ antiporter subunit E [Solirubrobacter pauli]|uniref:Multicomponent K+:H+ antiporter subunit E/multicomponent Na+:H+ antiporter subunit E n=1 Tax=Solirubrobacter pauli TaxID=166793 RepID=A0A660LGZ4_9ACTN|nr:Na+/H+ antiporter subunit E [Solirubrobacter pauli]RKQ93200.1 multicomponent K+:H+ antiporter subunit E/multicomponent Na+:H+ antiporter subunit E [Solirubrobacter pauli]